MGARERRFIHATGGAHAVSPKPPDILRKSHAHSGRKERAAIKERLRHESLDEDAQASGTEYRGGCHCGALTFVYRTDIAPSLWSLRACQCSFCRRHGAVTTSDPAGTVRFVERVPGCLVRYRFGSGATDFLLCNRCGTYVCAMIETATGRWSTINTNTLDRPPSDLPPAEPVSYEGETAEARLSRRQQRWTPAR
jgi:hypothetical protein